MKHILFVHNIPATFVRLDEEILRARYQVTTAHIRQRHADSFYHMWQQTRGIDLVIAWFASWHSLPAFVVAWVRGIPRLLITGGYDVANEPEIGYGLQQGGLPRVISSMVFRLANRVVPFSEYAYHETLANTPARAENTAAIPLGVPEVPALAESSQKERLALTVGTIDRLSVERKGVRVFVEAARFLPEVSFIVVGKGRDKTIDELKRIAPPNVHFTGYIPDDALTTLRKRAKVYVQASVHEGFGLAVAESMLARCIPVVTKRGSLPEVVGDTGILLSDSQPETIAQAIRTALESGDDAGERARTRILENFPLDRRAQTLYREIDALLDKRS